MAVTRIKNNQITDATINAAAKVTSYSITSGLISNNLTYGSDLTITGNLTVQGNTTTIDTIDLTVEDPIILLAAGQTGSPTVDIGFIGKRGTSDNIAFVWDESASQFVTAFTTSATTNTNITINSYASLQSLNITASGNLAVTGTTSLTGNVTVGNLFVGSSKTINVGNNIITNVATPVGNSDAATKEYVDGIASSGFTVEDDTANTTVIGSGDTLELFGTANEVTVAITAPDQVTFGLPDAVTVTKTLTAGNLSTGGTASATGTITGGNLATAGTASAGGNVTGANLITGGVITATGTITGGNLATAGTASAGGNVTGANLITGGVVTATGNINSGANITAAANISGVNYFSTGFVTASGNITGGNLISGVVTNTAAMTISTAAGNLNLNPTGNIVLNNKYINGLNQPVLDNDAASKIYVDNMASTQLAYHAAVLAATVGNLAAATGGAITYNNGTAGVGATLTTTGTFTTIDTANVATVGTRILVKDQADATQNGIYVYTTSTVITRSTDADTYGPNSTTDLSINDYFFVQSGDVNKGSAYIVDAPSGVITFGTSNISFAQFSSSQTYTANTSAGLALNSTTFSAKVDNNTTAFDGSGNIVVKTSANLTTPNIGAATGTSLSVSGNVDGGNLNTGGQVVATGNITGGNLLTSGAGGAISGSGNITGGNLITGGLITATGTITSTTTITGGNLATAGTASAGGNVTGGNLITGGIVTATGTITGGNLATAGTASAGGNVTGANLITGGVVTATGTITGGNLATGGTASATGTITGGNLATGGTASVTGNITGGNITTAGKANLGNIVISGDNITDTNGRVNFNTALGAVDFAVNGTAANVLYVSAAGNSISVGSSTQVTNAIATFNTTTSILIPVGTTGQRPSVGVTGMMRFNTSVNNLEFYDNDSWETAGSTFTVITANTQSGNGVQTAFTLPANSTTAGTIVAINGVVQIPVTAYAVTGNVCTFTEAPVSTDVIDFRVLATTSTVAGISGSGGGIVEASATAANVNVTGNLIVSSGAFYGDGSGLTNLSVSGDAIINGTSNMTVVSSGGNIRANVAGTTVQTISAGLVAITGDLSVSGNATLSGNILGDRIQNGTTTIDIQTANGNANITVGGTSNVAVFTTTGANVAGTLSASGNITGSYILGNGSQLTGIDATSIQSGTSNVKVVSSGGNVTTSVGGTSNVLVVTGTGANVAGTLSASGNVSGGNLSGTNIVGTLTTASQTNITSVGALNAGSITSGFGAIDIGTDTITVGGIINANGNGIGNIGSSSGFFNTVFAKATSAQYADLAEKYVADAEYAPGTVVEFGGNAEVTLSTQAGSTRVAGVVSTNPSYIMNAGLTAEHVAMVALQGRVPCRVVGLVAKGDLMVAAGNGAAKADNAARAGTIIGKALENFDGAEGTIEVVVGRN